MIPTELSDWTPWSPQDCRRVEMEGPDGRGFEILLRTPSESPPVEGWPCLLALDGERFFGALAGAASALSQRPEKTGVQPMVVAAVAHRAKGGEGQRSRDFTSGPCPEPGWAGPFGGAPAFREFLLDHVLPCVKAAAPIDGSRLALMGHSLAGLFVLETLEAAPQAFARWISLSPSLWWRTPEPTIAHASLMVGWGEAETARDMHGRITRWTKAARVSAVHVAPGADHGSAPFALIPDALRHAGGR
jgi:predicted alpha/beta superfamily hydrolase